jgi:hypothetical protein
LVASLFEVTSIKTWDLCACYLHDTIINVTNLPELEHQIFSEIFLKHFRDIIWLLRDKEERYGIECPEG